MSINAYTEKQEKLPMCNLTLQLKELEKEQSPQINRMEIKIIAEIKEIKTENRGEKAVKLSLFFEKINKIGQSLAPHQGNAPVFVFYVEKGASVTCFLTPI